MFKKLITGVLLIIIIAFSACELGSEQEPDSEPEWNYVADSDFEDGWSNVDNSTPLSYYMEKNGAVYLRGDIEDLLWSTDFEQDFCFAGGIPPIISENISNKCIRI